MVIALTGATGFVGSRLLRRLIGGGERVHVLGRRQPEIPNIDFFQWQASDPAAPAGAFEGCDAIVHLAGTPVATRWTDEVKRQIRSTRVDGTRSIVRGLTGARTPPRILVSGSAVGYYGDRGDETLTETSPPGSGFLPEVCMEWEQAARQAEASGVRVITVRLGIVLGKQGALGKMLTPFRLGLGGPLASGRQWMSWIHIEDVVELILFAIGKSNVSGAVNGVAPQPVRNSEFTKALGETLRRPAMLPVPRVALKAIFGEGAEVMLASQRVIPAAAASAGFRFRYEDVRTALAAAVRESA